MQGAETAGRSSALAEPSPRVWWLRRWMTRMLPVQAPALHATESGRLNSGKSSSANTGAGVLMNTTSLSHPISQGTN